MFTGYLSELTLDILDVKGLIRLNVFSLIARKNISLIK